MYRRIGIPKVTVTQLDPSESSSDSEEENEPRVPLIHTEAEIRDHHSARLKGDPPLLWYFQVATPRGTARLLWWGLDTKTQNAYATVAKSYGAHCTSARSDLPF